jgi:hypothetical protein
LYWQTKHFGLFSIAVSLIERRRTIHGQSRKIAVVSMILNGPLDYVSSRQSR